jgi:hypothetical protein
LQDGGNSVAPAKRASGDSRAFSLTMTAVKAKGSQMTATLPESRTPDMRPESLQAHGAFTE